VRVLFLCGNANQCGPRPLIFEVCESYEGESVNRSKNVCKMEVKDFPYVSLRSSIVQLHENLAIRDACAYSEADFGSQYCDRV
jgi:hypothetical protein